MYCAEIANLAEIGTHSGIPPSDAVRSLIFMANVAAQEVTGLIDASHTAEELLEELTHPGPDHELIILELLDGEAPPDTGSRSSRTKHGYLLTPARGNSAPHSLHHDPLGWLMLSLPTRQNTHVAEAELVLDVEFQPLPGCYRTPLEKDGNEVVRRLLHEAVALCRAEGRTALIVWHQLPLDVPAHESYLSSALRHHSFTLASEEFHFRLPVSNAVEYSGMSSVDVLSYYDSDFPTDLLPEVADCYTHASAEMPRGTLPLLPEKWNESRLAENTEHFRSRGTRNVTAIAVDAGTVVGISEAWIDSLNAEELPRVAELGMTFVHEKHRREGIGTMLLNRVLAMLEADGITCAYGAVNVNNKAGRAFMCTTGAAPISKLVAWACKVS